MAFTDGQTCSQVIAVAGEVTEYQVNMLTVECRIRG